MTHTPQQRANVWSVLGRRTPELLKNAFDQANQGAISWDNDTWEDTLAWVTGPLARMILYDPELPPDQRGTKHPMYARFEMFNRFSMEGGPLRDPKTIRFMWAVLRMYVELELRALLFYKVRYSAVDIEGMGRQVLDGVLPALPEPAVEVESGVPLQRTEP